MKALALSTIVTCITIALSSPTPTPKERSLSLDFQPISVDPPTWNVPETNWRLFYNDPSPYSQDPDFPSSVEVTLALLKFRERLTAFPDQQRFITPIYKFVHFGVRLDMVDQSALVAGPANITYGIGANVLAMASVAYIQLELSGPQRWGLKVDIGFGNIRKADVGEAEGLTAVEVGGEGYQEYVDIVRLKDELGKGEKKVEGLQVLR